MELTSIKRYEKKSIPDLLKIAVRHFNAYIRKRDEGNPCINCGRGVPLQCGHFFPSTISTVRFDEDNTHGECLKCNYFDSQSHSYKYRVNLIKKIGKEKFEALELKAAMHKKGFKWDRYALIDIIEKYKSKVKA